jgi:transposase-like protein
MGPAIERKKCPECRGGQYRFRARRLVPGEDGRPPVTETKYRCVHCEHEWKVRVESSPAAAATPAR